MITKEQSRQHAQGILEFQTLFLKICLDITREFGDTVRKYHYSKSVRLTGQFFFSGRQDFSPYDVASCPHNPSHMVHFSSENSRGLSAHQVMSLEKSKSILRSQADTLLCGVVKDIPALNAPLWALKWSYMEDEKTRRGDPITKLSLLSYGQRSPFGPDQSDVSHLAKVLHALSRLTQSPDEKYQIDNHIVWAQNPQHAIAIDSLLTSPKRFLNKKDIALPGSIKRIYTVHERDDLIKQTQSYIKDTLKK